MSPRSAWRSRRTTASSKTDTYSLCRSINMLVCKRLTPLVIKKHVAPDRRISIEDHDMRHGRKSSAKTFNGFKEHFAMDLDSTVTREVVVRPANEPEHEAVELLAEELEKAPGLLQLDIDLGYMASPRIAQWAEQGVDIIARPWPQVGPLFTKQAFILDFAARQVTCPGGQTVPLVPGKDAQFPAGACDVWPL